MFMARKIIIAIMLELIAKVGLAQPCAVTGLNFNNSGNSFQIAFDARQSPRSKVFILADPARLVVDLKDARTVGPLPQPPAGHPLFAKVRWAVKNNDGVRIVVDLKEAAGKVTTRAQTAQLAVVLDAGASGGQTPDAGGKAVMAANADPPVLSARAEAAAVKKSAQPKAAAENDVSGSIVVAIDAGHGGKDSGAKGPNGTFEKKITFTIAQKLARLINRQTGMKAVMVRKGDYFVGLRKRMEIARAANADLFISIHADAFHDTGVRGASVYTLSNNAASSEAARWLADNENAADLIGGITLGDKPDLLANVLMELSQTATQEASYYLANHILDNFQNVCVLHKDAVQKAGFVVLKSPDIPSILVETAFISNPLEEQNLLNPVYQDKIATAIFKGIRHYFQQPRPDGNRDRMALL